MELSVKDSIDQIRMLLVKVRIGDYNLTFDIDTGSTENIIFDYVFNQLKESFRLVEGGTKMMGIDGNYEEHPFAETTVGLGEKEIPTKFSIINADQTIINLQNDYGFQLHGILGIPFLVDNHCVIDFNNKTITIEGNKSKSI